MCEFEFEHIGVVDLLEVLVLPRRGGVLADRLLLGQLHVVQHPVGSHFGDVGQEDGNRALHVDIAHSEI